MRRRQVHLVDESGTISEQELKDVAAALQIQVDRDFSPEWGSQATITAGAVGATGSAWRLRMVTPDKLPHGAGGVHLDQHGRPYAMVGDFSDWTVAASHELLEMLVDPFGRKVITGPSIDPAADNRTVYYLVEVCDPCEVFTYDINGVTVSDFVLQDYYHSQAGAGVDEQGKLEGPLSVPKGCYISWFDPADNHWHQQRPDGTIVTASKTSKLDAHPRAQRDHAFGDTEDRQRHDLHTILASYRL